MADDRGKKADGKGQGKKTDEDLTRDIESAINRVPHGGPQHRALLFLRDINQRCLGGLYIKLATRQQILNDLLNNNIPSDRDMMHGCDRRPYHEWYSAVLLHDVHDDDDIPLYWRESNHVMPFVEHLRDILNGVDKPCPLRKKGKAALKEGKKRKRNMSVEDEEEDEESEDRQNQQDSRRLAAQRTLPAAIMGQHEASTIAHNGTLNRPQLQGTPSSAYHTTMNMPAHVPSAHRSSGSGMSYDSLSTNCMGTMGIASQQSRMPARNAPQLSNPLIFQRSESYLDSTSGSQQTFNHHHHGPQFGFSHQFPTTPGSQDGWNTGNGYSQRSAASNRVYQQYPGAHGAASNATLNQLSRHIHQSLPTANLQRNASTMHHPASLHDGQVTSATQETGQQVYNESGRILTIQEAVPDRGQVPQQPQTSNQQSSAVLPGSTDQNPYGQQPDVYRWRPRYHMPNHGQTDTAATHASRIGHRHSGSREMNDHEASQ
ncbi:hypothetical protein CkaCkLH20_07098 [Colletotrichum karsti]|uniref:Uncharacterized protein n=1 Tax=Colletotrichum karsti TaxID=1095194 RepID=A0A9P6LJ33_9PEZI|nr:uncharacterized protein CkaCkLH20_07098 [Colletotrichum karsti]KAF9875278.1 hypothetical protein CkaCkLH20_07098 [Colletotrichum karsti]